MVARRNLTEGGSYFTAPKKSIDFIHSGSKLLDLVLGGGWAERRIGNVVGNASAGKTLITIEAAHNFAEKYPKGKVFHRETEDAWDDAYAEALGMPLQVVDKARLDTVEDFFEDVDGIVKSKTKQPMFYILDSLDAISSRAEMARDIDESSYGTERAKQISQMFRRRIPAAMNKANLTMIIVSQVRQKVGVLIGKKWTVAGGEALSFYASQRIKLNQIKEISNKVRGISRTSGIVVKADCFKNKVGLPFRECEFAINFAYGIDDLNECMDFLADTNGLGEVDVAKTKIKEFIKATKRLPTPEFRKELSRIHSATEKVWYDIEREFLPKRSKYK